MIFWRQLFVQDRFELPNAALKWKIIERALKHAGEMNPIGVYI